MAFEYLFVVKCDENNCPAHVEDRTPNPTLVLRLARLGWTFLADGRDLCPTHSPVVVP